MPPEGTFRKRAIPERLKNKRASEKEIKAWARSQLNGIESSLSKDEIESIKNGSVSEILLKPKKPGFFLSDGTFIESFGFNPEFGGDFDEAERKWSMEEEDREWADRENASFNKLSTEKSQRMGQAIWEHGRRVVEYANSKNRSISRIIYLLDERKGADGYSRHAHQTSIDFFRWKPDISGFEDIIDWNWERIDSVLRFSIDNHVRDHLLSLLRQTELGSIPDDRLSRLLGRKRRKQDDSISEEELIFLDEFRNSVKKLETPSTEQIDRCISIVSKRQL